MLSFDQSCLTPEANMLEANKALQNSVADQRRLAGRRYRDA
jgi:hypothetical protein